MQCGTALSTKPDTEAAIAEVLDRLSLQFPEEPADFAVAFVSAHHVKQVQQLGEGCLQRKIARHFLLCTGETIIGEDSEVEESPAVSLWAIRMPENSRIQPVRLTWSNGGLTGLPSDGSLQKPDQTLILLTDPFGFTANFSPENLLTAIETASPGVRIVGGMASAGNSPGKNRLMVQDQVFHDGAVGLWIDAPGKIRTVVSQGCRPIGRPMIITKADKNVIKELGRRPAIDVLREMFADLDDEDQTLVQEGLHVGRVINEYQESFGRGDFLIRNVMGADNDGGIAITDLVRVVQTVQFQVRDAATADEDLRTLLAEEKTSHPTNQAAGALLFSCNGRGSRLFPAPDHDVTAIHNALGKIPVAGFFAMGELGPIGGKTFVHGFTASIAIFLA